MAYVIKLFTTLSIVPELTNELMAAQCFIFFFGGFDTSSTVISMTLLELTMNLDIQRRLQEEIDNAIIENGGQVTYDMVKNMPYLHKVVQGQYSFFTLFILQLLDNNLQSWL